MGTNSNITPRHHLYSKLKEAENLQRILYESTGLLLHATTSVQHTPELVTILRTVEEQVALLDSIDELVALDLEWTIPDSRLISVNISTADRDYYLPVLGKDFDNSATVELLKESLFRLVRRTTSIWHNAKADFKAQYAGEPLDLYKSPIEDTILMAYVSGEQSLGLKDLAVKLLNRKSPPLPANLETIPIEQAAHYGCRDTRNTFELFHLLKAKLIQQEQWDVYHDIELPLVPLVASMEKYGIPLDMVEVQRLRDKLYAEEESICMDIRNRFNLDFTKEPDQRAYLSANGFHSSSLSKDVLSKINAPWVRSLLDYRETRTLRRNFLDKHIAEWKAAGSPDEYYAYPTFNQAGRDTEAGWLNAPATGRFSSANPNLQNQPRAIRSCFVPPKDMRLVSLDYSALELRVAASLSQDPVMLSVLSSGGDLHQYMRDTILKHTGLDVGRPAAKTANFNLRYGGQADMLMTISAKQGAILSYDVAKEIVDIDRKTYTGYWNWFDGVIKSTTDTGFAKSLFNRRRYFDIVRFGDHEKRAAGNMSVQGTAADIIKTAMNKVVPIMQYYNAHLALQVHDELVFWVPEDVADRFVIAAKGIMESIQIPSLKLVVEGGAGMNWAEVH